MPYGGPGGPHGGPRGPMGRGFMNYHNHPSYYGPTIRPAARGYVAHDQGDFIGGLAASYVNIQSKFLEAKYRFGKKGDPILDEKGKVVKDSNGNPLYKYKHTMKSRMMGLRMITAGRHHANLFSSRVAAADELFKDKRLTDRQCAIRKLKAAKKYYDYLLKVGFINEAEHEFEMQKYGQEIGFEYVNDSPTRRH